MQNNDDYETLRELDEQIKKKKAQDEYQPVPNQESKKLEGAVEQPAKPSFGSQLKEAIVGKAQTVYQRTIPTPENVKKEQERYANPPKKEPIPNKGPRGYGRRLERKFATGAKEIPEQLDNTQKTVSDSTYEKIRPQYLEDTMPTMVVSAFGSMRPPPDIKPTIQQVRQKQQKQEKKKPVKKQYINEDAYQQLVGQYGKEFLDANGVESKRSKYYQDQSPFGRSVAPYRPVSFGQSFVSPNPPKTEYQRRLEEGRPYELYRPETVGSQLFRPLPAQNRMFSPMKPEYVFDAKGNIVSVRRRFFSPPIARL